MERTETEGAGWNDRFEGVTGIAAINGWRGAALIAARSLWVNFTRLVKPIKVSRLPLNDDKR